MPTSGTGSMWRVITALTEKKQDLVNLGNKIQEMRTERGKELQEELLRRHKEIVDEISQAITAYSAPQGYDLVIDKSSASAASGVSIVLYNSNKLIDITTEIVTIINKSAPPGSATTIPSGATSSLPTPATPATP